jgi:catechol 1,2-dioxygenase
MCRIVEEFDVTPTEFWAACGYVTRLGQANEVGLLVPGLGVETFLDVVMDEKERRAGLQGGTPRTIEGPLYITDAPLEKGEARLDRDPEEGEVLFVDGQVRDTGGTPVPGAIVDVWHANTKGFYSFFDPTPTPQSPYNLRRRIETDAEGRYRFRTIMPSGYGCPPDGPTQQLLDRLGRHGKRPAHVHFFVEAPGFRKLTTQINISDDPYLHDDFAFATREGLIPELVRHTDPAEIKARGLTSPSPRSASTSS